MALQDCIYSSFQLAGEFDVVVNCTGLGARELCKDDKVEPARGHILRVWIVSDLTNSRIVKRRPESISNIAFPFLPRTFYDPG